MVGAVCLAILIVWPKINEFFEKAYEEIFKEFSAENLETYAKSVQIELEKVFMSLSDEFDFNYERLREHSYEFDRKKKQIELLENKLIC